jgi:MFS transporter, DHA1 family, multidrug resistance protein
MLAVTFLILRRADYYIAQATTISAMSLPSSLGRPGQASPASSELQANRVLRWMCVIIAVTQLGFGAIVPVLPLYAQSFGVSVSAIGLTIAVYGLARFVLAIPCGRLADGIGRRPTLALGGAVSALGNLWCALANHYAEFLVARFVSGAGAAMVLTMGAVILADISPPERRGRMMATYQGVFLFAFGIGPLPGGLLAEFVGLAAPFYVYAAASVIGCLLAWYVIPETRDFASEQRGEAPAQRLPFRAQVRALTQHLGFLLVSLISLTSAIGRTGALFAIVPLLATVKLGLSAGQVGAGFAMASILGLIASYPAGALADRYGRKVVIVPATILNGVAIALFALMPSLSGFLAACALWGVASAVSGAAPAAYAADTAPPGMNAIAMSSFRMLADLGYVIGPIALGLLADLHSPEFALGCSGLLTVAVALLFARFAPETVARRAA